MTERREAEGAMTRRLGPDKEKVEAANREATWDVICRSCGTKLKISHTALYMNCPICDAGAPDNAKDHRTH